MRENFRKNLEEVLNEKHMSMKRLSREIDYDLRGLYRWKEGVALPSLEKFVELAAALDVSMERLIYGKEEAPQ